MIAWVSTCLLAGWASTLFSESVRTTWMTWGSFGLAAAVGLDVSARIGERRRMEEMKLTATKRFERDISYETQENEANAAIREVITRILGRRPKTLQNAGSRRTQKRHPCNLDVELLLDQGFPGSSRYQDGCRCNARVTNLSESGFELKLTEPLPRQRMKMSFAAARGGREMLLGELLWCDPQPDGSIVAGGRFLNAFSAAGA
jgi:hypothetical protein